ncbi:MAG: chloride channel protein [Halioglobus sp.]|nr:chloride channel protein [Halioglobus sp.]
MQKLLSDYRRRLRSYDSVLAYSLLGVVGGIASGLVVILFEVAIGQAAMLFGVGAGGEDFESLPRWMLFALPAAGATTLGIAFSLLDPQDRETGIVHVLSRMHSHYSVLPLKNTLVQFFGGVFCLATGQSGGREGPGIHLGGAVNSLLGQRFGLPNNSLRMLIACGTAGGIAAAFQTPLAGVIFAMEVIIAEYTVVGFVPVILAAVSASAVSRTFAVGGGLVSLPQLELASLTELPLVMLLGLACGVAVAVFIRITHLAAGLGHWPVFLRFALAGVLTGTLAYAVPQVLGMGYDTLSLALGGQLAVSALLLIALCKIVATAVTCGLGMPVGLIGPNLLIGACLGGALGALVQQWLPGSSDPAVYIVIGMGAAMGAVLNAPLAAILAVVELTGTLGLSMAALLAIVIATLTNSDLFGQRSAHQSVLSQLRRNIPEDPLSRLLHRTDVNATMDSNAVRVPVILGEEDLVPLLEYTPAWCLIERDGDDLYLVSGSELIEWLELALTEAEDADVTEAGIRRWSSAPVPPQATLRQAVDTMRTQTTEAVHVLERSASTGRTILHGVVTRESIERFTLASVL